MVKGEQMKLETIPTETVVVPKIDEVKRLAREALGDLAVESDEFGRLMRLLIPKIVVFPYRLCDGGKIVLRARFRLQLSRLVPDIRAREVLQQPLERVLTVDLFDPPQREACRRRIFELRVGGIGIDGIVSSRLTARARSDPFHQFVVPARVLRAGLFSCADTHQKNKEPTCRTKTLNL